MSTSDMRAGIDRRFLITGLAAGLASLSAPSWAAAPAILSGKGNYRALALDNQRTGEWMHTVYWADGAYIPEAMQSINHILRDWRQDLTIEIDPTVIDILSATGRMLDCDEPFKVVSGYRSPETNRMLRKQRKGVASKSYHIKGMAVDVSMKDRSVSQIAGAGKALRSGGVGKYTRSNFVHLDSGPVRGWGR